MGGWADRPSRPLSITLLLATVTKCWERDRGQSQTYEICW